MFKQETIRLHQEDAISTKLWVEKSREKYINAFYKSKLDLPPQDSVLQEDTFLLFIQTAFQLDAFWCLGCWFIRIDVTHNTTQYKDIQLFTVIAWDCWGHGM